MLITALCCQIMPCYASAEEDTHDSVFHDNGNFQIQYSMDGDKVVENITFLANPNIEVNRTVSPNGDMIVATNSSGHITISVLTNSDYSAFYQLYLMQNTPSPLNSDLTGSQYIHEYIGTPPAQTFYYSEIKDARDVSALAAIILSKWTVNAAIATGVASWIFDRMLDSMNNYDKVIVETDTYQVLFAIDHSYYIHCYHEKTKFYKANASSPSETLTDFYQVYGG